MNKPIPLSMPEELHKLVRETAADTGLSQQDVMRQSIKIGAPKLLEQFKGQAGECPGDS